MLEFEVFLNDLKPKTQKAVLKFFKIKNANEGNFDISPLFILGNDEDLPTDQET